MPPRKSSGKGGRKKGGGYVSGAYAPTRGKHKGETFASYRQYQNRLAQEKGLGSHTSRLATPLKPTLAIAKRPSYQRGLEALRRMRRGESIAKAASEARTSPEVVRRYFSAVLSRSRGRITVAKADKAPRLMIMLTAAGPVDVFVLGSHEAQRLSAYMNDVAKFAGGTVPDLTRYAGRTIRTSEGRLPLLTDEVQLIRLAFEGRLQIDGLYPLGAIA